MEHKCGALKLVEAKLAEHNTKLDWVHSFGNGMSYVLISTSLVEKKRGARPYIIVPNYCPFCGKCLIKRTESVLAETATND